MKNLLALAALTLLFPLGAMAQTVELTTAAGILGGKGSILGTAKGVAVTSGTTSTTSPIKYVYYQREGESKIRRARIIRTTDGATAATTVTWMIDVKGIPATGRRYTFWAEDAAGSQGDGTSRRFKKVL